MPDEVNILKIDVEGYEPNVLSGAINLLGRTNELLIEYSRTSVETICGVDAFIGLLASFQYLYEINERSHALSEFSRSDFYATYYVNVFASKWQLSNVLIP